MFGMLLALLICMETNMTLTVHTKTLIYIAATMPNKAAEAEKHLSARGVK
jgi:hypothetical protein